MPQNIQGLGEPAEPRKQLLGTTQNLLLRGFLLKALAGSHTSIKSRFIWMARHADCSIVILDGSVKNYSPAR